MDYVNLYVNYSVQSVLRLNTQIRRCISEIHNYIFAFVVKENVHAVSRSFFKTDQPNLHIA